MVMTARPAPQRRTLRPSDRRQRVPDVPADYDQVTELLEQDLRVTIDEAFMRGYFSRLGEANLLAIVRLGLEALGTKRLNRSPSLSNPAA